MVDADSVFAKLARLDSLLGVLEGAQARGIDHARLWDSLGELDDLRAFAAAAERLAREG